MSVLSRPERVVVWWWWIASNRYPPARPLVRPPVRPPVPPSVRPSVRPSVHPSVRPSVLPSVRPSVRPPVRSPVRPSIRPSVLPSVRPSVRPPAHPPTWPRFPVGRHELHVDLQLRRRLVLAPLRKHKSVGTLAASYRTAHSRGVEWLLTRRLDGHPPSSPADGRATAVADCRFVGRPPSRHRRRFRRRRCCRSRCRYHHRRRRRCTTVAHAAGAERSIRDANDCTAAADSTRWANDRLAGREL